MLKLLCKNPGQRLDSLRQVGIVVATFLVEHVVAVVVAQGFVEVDVASDSDDLVASVVAAVAVVAGFADVVFDDYRVCAAVDVDVVAGVVVVVVVVVVAVEDVGVPAVAHVHV